MVMAVWCCLSCRAFVGRSFAKSVDEAKYTFFSDDLPEEDAIKWVELCGCWYWVALCCVGLLYQDNVSMQCC
jgi:hypothetical protein